MEDNKLDLFMWQSTCRVRDNIVSKEDGGTALANGGRNLQGFGRKKATARMRGVGKEFPLSWRKTRRSVREVPGSDETVS